MTPGRGVGANTALRDAALLAERLDDAQRDKLSGHDAVADYEAEMRRHGFHAVVKSRKQFDARRREPQRKKHGRVERRRAFRSVRRKQRAGSRRRDVF